MSRLRLYTGRFETLVHFAPQIEQRVKEGRQDFLVLLPVNRAVRYYKKRLVDAAPGGILTDPLVFTFDDLLTRLYRSLPGAKKIISPEMFHLLVRQILEEHRDEFRFFSTGAEVTTGLVRKTADMIKELRRFGYNGIAFSKLAIPETDFDPDKFGDFQRLLQRLDERLGDSFIDEPFARHQAAVNLSEELFRKNLPGVAYVYVSGYGLFTPAMFRFIEQVCRWAQVNVKLEYTEENPTLFRHTAQAAKRLTAMGAQVVKPREPGFLSRFLFHGETFPNKKEDLRERIHIYGLVSQREEVAFIAAKIRDLHFKEGIPLHRMAVTFANMERYVPEVRRVFREFELPVNLSTGFPLIQSPLVRHFLNTLRLAASGFPLKDVFQLLQSPFVGAADRINSDFLYRILVKYRVRRLTPGWQQRLTETPEYENGADQPDETNLALQVELLAAYLEPYYQLPQEATPVGFSERLRRFWKDIGLFDWYRKDNRVLTERQKENEFRAFNRFVALVEKLFWSLQELYGQRKITLSKWMEIIQESTQQAVYNLTEWPDYGVQIMPRLEILAVDADVLFIGGMIDGDFPRASARDIFFNDRVRLEMGLVAAEELLDQDRILFYTLLDAPVKKILLTYPRAEEESALVPSTFLDDLEEIARVTRSDQPAEQSFLLNKKQLWQNWGLALQRQDFEQAAEWFRLLLQTGRAEAQLSSVLRRLRALTNRLYPGQFSQYEGWLAGSEKVKQKLRDWFGRTVWSATRLERYAFCPLSFFLQDILKIEDLPEIEDEISAQERGILTHRILFRFYRELQRQGQTAFPANHMELLLAIAREELERLPYSGVFWELERMRLLGWQHKAGMLQKFIEEDQKQIGETGYVPALFELGFGFGGDEEKDAGSRQKPVALQHAHGRLTISGRIDRVDVDGQKRALVWDYKTGLSAKTINAETMSRGYYLQLPLYLLALRQIQPGLKPVFGGYFFVRDATTLARRPALADAAQVDFVTGNAARKALVPNPTSEQPPARLNFDQFLDFMLQTAAEAVNRLLDGQFNHSLFPEEKLCQSYCPYRRLCQKNVGKLKRLAEQRPANHGN